MPTVHWLGAGLSSGPGIRRLAEQGHSLVLWNRTLSKAESILAGLHVETASARQLDWDQLASATKPGDVLVSMLPATMHLQVAQICLDRKAHFVSTSYISPEMHELADQATAAGLCLVNESGLDPGIDHLMAHSMMADYQASGTFDKQNAHYFRSYCGGLSKEKNDFRYKFSWSPLGVLRALTSQARWLEEGDIRTSQRPWHAITKQTVRLPDGGAEVFEAYPNRDSTPYVEEYGFGSDWNVQQFVRGTLRYDGWSDAWRDIFELVESTDELERDRVLTEKSEQLWQEHRFEDGEADRVTLTVELEVRRDNQPVWHQVYSLDESGNERGSAMARLVSLPASIAVDSAVDGTIQPGVSGAPQEKQIVDDWMNQLAQFGERAEKIVIV